ncbi:MAG: exonuclease domain-containing protein [Bacteriovoracaceae bacterium]
MRYLSIDLEATGLAEHDRIIEFAAVPFDTETGVISNDLGFHHFIKCPSFEELRPSLDQWVIDHNESLITKAHEEGLEISDFKNEFESYLNSQEIKDYFGEKSIILFGKSMNAIDLPFLNRDLGWSFIRKYFHHQQLDLSSVVYSMINMKLIPEKCSSGSFLMEFTGLGEVKHTALEDAINTAEIYFKLLKISEQSLSKEG